MNFFHSFHSLYSVHVFHFIHCIHVSRFFHCIHAFHSPGLVFGPPAGWLAVAWLQLAPRWLAGSWFVAPGRPANWGLVCGRPASQLGLTLWPAGRPAGAWFVAGRPAGQLVLGFWPAGQLAAWM
jgi:hypothetical protein